MSRVARQLSHPTPAQRAGPQLCPRQRRNRVAKSGAGAPARHAARDPAAHRRQAHSERRLGRLPGAARACARVGALSQGECEARGGGHRGGPHCTSPVGGAAVRSPRCHLLEGGRLAGRAAARRAECRDDARSEQERAAGRDRQRLRADRFLALQRALHGGDLSPAAIVFSWYLELSRSSPARGFRLRRHAVQFHLDRRQSADRAGALGQHRPVEAGLERRLFGALHLGDPRGSRPAGRRDQFRPRQWQPGRRSGARQPGVGRHSLHRQYRRVPVDVGARRQEHSPLQVLSAPGRRDRRQGFHLRASHPPTWMPS